LKKPPAKKTLDVAIGFIIPTIVLLRIFSQVRAFFGYRSNLGPNLIMMRFALPDVFVLMIVGAIPDVVQACVKLMWALGGRSRVGLRDLST
jgi:hypothetical protein